MPKREVRITFEFSQSVPAAGPPVVAADVRWRDQHGSWERVLDGEQPIVALGNTEAQARRRAVAALDKLFGVGGYDLVN